MTKDDAVKILIMSAICSSNMCNTCVYNDAEDKENDLECSCDFTYDLLKEAVATLGYNINEKLK